ncbi:MAG: sigma-70 family RNA polymerase sigma factor [Sandaracinus sp.]
MNMLSSSDRQALLDVGLPIVRRVAHGVARRIPSHVDIGDLMGAGTEGLLKAVSAYDPVRSDRFEPYAETRIRGAILDELRSIDAMTQHGRRRMAAVNKRTWELERALGRAPSDEEVAEALGIPVSDYLDLLATASHASGMTSGAECDPDLVAANGPDPQSLCAEMEERRRLAEAIAKLPTRLQEVLGLYYQHECTQAEIGRMLGVTESRVCQLLSDATSRLRFVLGEVSLGPS